MADPRRDREHYDDLAGIDLRRLDLDDIELEDEHPITLGRWLALLGAVATASVILWVPQSDFYRLSAHQNLIFFLLCGGGIIVGLTLGRLLVRWAQEAAARYVAKPRQAEPDKPASALVRYSTLAVIAGGALAIINYVPAGSYYSDGGEYRTLWYLGALGAIVVGVLLGRWLLMQATARAAADTGEPVRIVLPPWFKWVSLGVLVALGLTALVGAEVFGAQGDAEFGFGAIGFVAGLGGAIWLARRFDELERNRPQR